jgi:hypothetical protein
MRETFSTLIFTLECLLPSLFVGRRQRIRVRRVHARRVAAATAPRRTEYRRRRPLEAVVPLQSHQRTEASFRRAPHRRFARSHHQQHRRTCLRRERPRCRRFGSELHTHVPKPVGVIVERQHGRAAKRASSIRCARPSMGHRHICRIGVLRCGGGRGASMLLRRGRALKRSTTA